MSCRRSWPRVVVVGTVVALLTFAAGSTAIQTAQADAETGEELAAGNSVVVAAGRTIDRDYFAVAERVEIAGTINGDAHLLAREVIVTGTINGDLLAAGATVHLVGTIAQNARIFAGRLVMTGQVGRNLSVTAGQIQIDSPAEIRGALVGGGGTVHIEAPVAHNVTVAGRAVTLAGSVGGNVNAAAADLQVTSTAKIVGRLSYLGHRPPTIHDQAQVGGSVTRRAFPTLRVPWSESVEEVFHWIGLALLLVSGVSTLVLGLVLIGLFPRPVDRTVTELAARPFGSGIMGLLVCLGAPLLVGILVLSLVGIPLAFVLTAVLGILFYAARIFAMMWVGRSVQSKFGATPTRRPAFMIGWVLYYALRAIPGLGTVVGILTTLLGLGAIVRATFAREEIGPAEPVAPGSGPRLMAQDFS